MSEVARILVVDDEQNILNSLQRLFRRYGYEVVTCLSGKDALDVLEQSPDFTLVITDYRMPGMNGVEFLKKVSARWPDTVRIVLSGYADTGAVIAATNEGNIYKFIPKPWDDQELLNAVKDAFEYYDVRMSRRKTELLQNILKNSPTEHMVTLAVYETLFDEMPVGIIGIDNKGVIVKVNEYAHAALGISDSLAGGLADTMLPLELLNLLNNDQNASGDQRVNLEINGKNLLALVRSFNNIEMTGIILIII